MSFKIETPRLILRDFLESDWAAVHAYAADAQVVRHMNWGPNTEAETKAFIALAITLSQAQPRRSYHLAVVVKETGQVIGGATLRMLDAEPLSGELGYTLNPLFWGHGYATELALGLVQHGFLELGLHRIWATCRPENISSYRILMKVGLTFEEYLQNEKLVRGQWVDSFLCGLSREAWLQSQIASASVHNGRNGH